MHFKAKIEIQSCQIGVLVLSLLVSSSEEHNNYKRDRKGPEVAIGHLHLQPFPHPSFQCFLHQCTHAHRTDSCCSCYTTIK